MLGIGACTIGATGLKFGTELGFPPLGGYSKFLGRLPPTSWAQEAKECFWKAVLPKPCISVKSLLNNSCQYSEGGGGSGHIRSRTSPSALAGLPSERGRSAALVLGLGPIGLKLARRVTHTDTVTRDVLDPWTPNPGWGRPKSGSGGPNCVLLAELYKTKVVERPRYSGVKTWQVCYGHWDMA